MRIPKLFMQHVVPLFALGLLVGCDSFGDQANKEQQEQLLEESREHGRVTGRLRLCARLHLFNRPGSTDAEMFIAPKGGAIGIAVDGLVYSVVLPAGSSMEMGEPGVTFMQTTDRAYLYHFRISDFHTAECSQ